MILHSRLLNFNPKMKLRYINKHSNEVQSLTITSGHLSLPTNRLWIRFHIRIFHCKNKFFNKRSFSHWCPFFSLFYSIFLAFLLTSRIINSHKYKINPYSLFFEHFLMEKYIFSRKLSKRQNIFWYTRDILIDARKM